MGYFNIFYKITRIIDMLTRKRNRRAIMVILIIIAVIFILHNKGYCAQEDTTYTTDTTYFIIERYSGLLNDFVLSFDKWYGKNESYTNRFNTIFESIQNGNFLYLYQNGLDGNCRIMTYGRSTSKTLVDTSLVYNDGTRVPSTAYNITWLSGNSYYYIELGNNYSYALNYATASADFNYSVPFILLYKVPTEIISCMERAGYGYQNNQDIIDIKALLQAQNEKLDTTNEELGKLTNTTVDNSVIEVPEDTVNDITESGVNNIYNTIISMLGYDYASNHTYWEFDIPFINQHFSYMAR